jgi:transketolase
MIATATAGPGMRAQLADTVSAVIAEDTDVVLLLGDIGVRGFRHAAEAHPDRVYNIGILEPTTVGLAAGLARAGMVPVVHTIAPFLVERSFEQIKIDFGYQQLGGNFVSVGASYDYAALGCTHHCPGDVALLATVPGMEIVVPGTAADFDTLFRDRYRNTTPTYYRLSERTNRTAVPVTFGEAQVVREGNAATVIAVGPMLDAVLDATEGMDVTVLYYTTILPFDARALYESASRTGRVFAVEPFYAGTLAHELQRVLAPIPVRIDGAGVPRQFLTHYGTAAEHDSALGLTAPALRNRLEAFLDA